MLKLFYNLFSYLFEAILPLLKLLSPKMKLFVEGRKETKKFLENWKSTDYNWLWFHCASLGEFEQALPLIENLKKESDNKVLVTFFSPSGYQQKKNHKLLDAILYLPIDTPKNAKRFIKAIKPKAAFFIKYEFWENFFKELKKEGIPIYMVSSAFRENQIYFKWYGSFFKNTLKNVTHFFVQNKASLEVLHANGFNNVTISGDTRFDRVYAQLQMNNELDFIADFKKNRTCVVLGSTWPDCETVFIESINTSAEDVCFIIAPHEIKDEKIKALRQRITTKTAVFSKGIEKGSKVLIIDAIGYLTRIYSYADIVYVGGAIGATGLHNILEPAVFGIPIITGTNTSKFPEAQDLESFGGLIKVSTKKEFASQLNKLIRNKTLRDKMSEASAQFIRNQIDATNKVLEKIKVK